MQRDQRTSLRQAKAQRDAAEAEARRAQAAYRATIRQLLDEGVTQREIATALGVSPQRVSKLLQARA